MGTTRNRNLHQKTCAVRQCHEDFPMAHVFVAANSCLSTSSSLDHYNNSELPWELLHPNTSLPLAGPVEK